LSDNLWMYLMKSVSEVSVLKTGWVMYSVSLLRWECKSAYFYLVNQSSAK